MTWSQHYLMQQVEACTIATAEFAELMASILTRGKPFRFRASGFGMFAYNTTGMVMCSLMCRHKIET